MSRTARRGNWIVTLPLAAGAIAYLVFVFVPGRQTTAELRSQIQDQQEYLSHAGAVGAALAAVEAELHRTEQYQTRWRTTAPVVAHISELFAQIHQVEREAGVQTTRFDPQPAISRDYLSEIHASLGCQGTFDRVFALLHGLESLPADVWLKKIHLEKTSPDSEDVRCMVDLVIFADNREKTDYVKNSFGR